jgi:hypothetical protein
MVQPIACLGDRPFEAFRKVCAKDICHQLIPGVLVRQLIMKDIVEPAE